MHQSDSNEPLVMGTNFLAQYGLNLFAVFDCHKLSLEIQQQLKGDEIPLDEFPRLVLIGNGGGAIWEALQQARIEDPNPIDIFSQRLVSRFIDSYLDGARSMQLYPGPTSVSLIRLGEMAGWSHPSPLGLGIHPEYGLWFAYRALFITTADIAPTPSKDESLMISQRSSHHSPCDSCVDKPCIAVCPAAAVSSTQPFNIPSCYNHRLATKSICADRCLSRLACPVGSEHRYPLAQIQYHYGYSLRSARAIKEE